MTSNNVRALIVHPDGTGQVTSINPTPDALQAVVGGYIEYIFVTEGVHGYLNEEGKILGLPANPVATRIAGFEGVDVLCGTVIFFGDGPEGEEGDLPPEWLRWATEVGLPWENHQ